MKLTFYPNSDKQGLASLAWQNDEVDTVIFGGGAGGGKSVWECSMITLDAIRWPDTRYFIGRKELKNLMATTYITLTQEVFTRMGLVRDYHWKFNGQQSVVYLRQSPQSKWSTISLLDLKHDPSDPLFDRYGSHPYTRGAFEEMSEIEFRAFEILISRVGRYRNKELGIKGKVAGTLNPSDEWPYRLFYDPWNKAKRPIDPYAPIPYMKAEMDGEIVEKKFVFIPVLAKENPDITRDYRVSLATITDPVLKARLEAGDWEFANAADILYTTQAIADVFTNSVKRSPHKYMTVDSARLGGDKIVRRFWRGWECYKVKWDVKKRTNETAEVIRNDLISEGIARENCLIDDPGGGVVDQVPGTIQFVGAGAPFGKVGEMEVKEQYENLRTQCVYYTAEKVEARQVAHSDPDVQVREWFAEEIKQFKRRDIGKSTKMKVSRKEEEIKPALGRSPDFADTFWMRAYFDLREREPKLNKKGGTMKVYNPDAVPKPDRARSADSMTVYIPDID